MFGKDKDFGFKFKIGQVVEHIGATPVDDGKERFWSRNERLFIVGRTLDECPGGIQRHYDVRPVMGQSPATKLVRFNEIELKEFSETQK